MSFISEKINGFKKRARCFSYGIFYITSGRFSIPPVLWVNGKRRKLFFNHPGSGEFRYEFTEICLNDCYQLGLLKTKLKKIRSVVDIGANQGLFLLAARKKFPGAGLQGYEPNLALQPNLGKNAEALKADVFFEAVTRENGRVVLNLSHSDLHSTTSHSKDGSIKATAFSQVIERAGGQVDILKLDCEGAEWELFEDGVSWQKVKCVTMEYHLWAKEGSSHTAVIDILQRLGFKIISSRPIAETFGLITAIRDRSFNDKK